MRTTSYCIVFLILVLANYTVGDLSLLGLLLLILLESRSLMSILTRDSTIV
jgi:hypothetical protein